MHEWYLRRATADHWTLTLTSSTDKVCFVIRFVMQKGTAEGHDMVLHGSWFMAPSFFVFFVLPHTRVLPHYIFLLFGNNEQGRYDAVPTTPSAGSMCALVKASSSATADCAMASDRDDGGVNLTVPGVWLVVVG